MPAHLARRPAVTTAVVMLSLLATAACTGGSGDSQARAGSTSTTTNPATTTSAAPTPRPPAVTGAGLPADLVAVLTTLYAGGRLPASAPVAAVLAKRPAAKAPITVGGEVRSWKGTPVASVVYGKDVTLAVKSARGWSVVGGWWPSLGQPRRTPSANRRILAIGSDARRNETVTKARADALHIIGLDKSGVGGIVGIPRDSWVPLSTGGNGKINAALVFGGPAAQTRTVARATGVQIDGYVMTGFLGFEEMVDSMGGIRYGSGSSLTSHVGKPLLKPGLNLLNGLTALNFARERKHVAGGDFGRSANQGRLIKAGMAMAKAAGPAKLPSYLQGMGPWITTDLTADEVLNLSATLYWTNPVTVPNEVAPGSIGTRDRQSVVLLGGQAASLFANIRDGRLG